METFLINQESFSLTQGQFLIRLLVAIGIGAVIGLERQYKAMKEGGHGYAGIRTFVFMTVLGLIGGLFYYLFSPWAYMAVFFGVSLLIGLTYWNSAQAGDRGATTELSSLIAFVLGTLTLVGWIEVSLMLTVIVVLVLTSKFRIKAIVGTITEEELYDIILFGVMALLIFPFLPDQAMGPYQVINPREIGWVILLTSGLGLVGYILTKFLGARTGILLGGIAGGLVSSTAVTWVYSKKSQGNDSISSSCATAILVASSIMFVRVLVWTFIFNKTLFNNLVPSIGLILLCAAGVIAYIFFKGKTKEVENAEMPLGKPLDIKGAIVFGVIYVVILLVVSYANENLGEGGIVVSSMIAGFSDIDAISISISKLTGVSLSLSTGGIAILVAAVSNTLVKMGIGFYAGSPSLRKNLLLGYGTMCLAAVIAFFLL